jgi:hypothetical protein
MADAGSIFGGLLNSIWGILTAIVQALQNYAGDIAEILVGAMLGYAVVRFGRRMFRSITGLVSLPF